MLDESVYFWCCLWVLTYSLISTTSFQFSYWIAMFKKWHKKIQSMKGNYKPKTMLHIRAIFDYTLIYWLLLYRLVWLIEQVQRIWIQMSSCCFTIQQLFQFATHSIWAAFQKLEQANKNIYIFKQNNCNNKSINKTSFSVSSFLFTRLEKKNLCNISWFQRFVWTWPVHLYLFFFFSKWVHHPITLMCALGWKSLTLWS